MSLQAELIGSLSRKSKSKASSRSISPENNPLIRKNKQLEKENQLLTLKVEQISNELALSNKENKSLKNKIYSLESNNQVLQEKTLDLIQKNEKLQKSTTIHSTKEINELKKEIQTLKKELSLKGKETSSPSSNQELPQKLSLDIIKTRMPFCSNPTQRGLSLLLELSNNSSEWIQIPNSKLSTVMETKYITLFRHEAFSLGLVSFERRIIPSTKRRGYFYKLNIV